MLLQRAKPCQPLPQNLHPKMSRNCGAHHLPMTYPVCVCVIELPMTSSKYLHGRASKLKAPNGTSFMPHGADRAVAPLQRCPSSQRGTLQSTHARQVHTFCRGEGFYVSLLFWALVCSLSVTMLLLFCSRMSSRSFPLRTPMTSTPNHSSRGFKR